MQQIELKENWKNSRKEVSADGEIVKVFYYNGDMKESHRNGLVKYLYHKSNTWHTTYGDGREVTEFSNGQREVSIKGCWK